MTCRVVGREQGLPSGYSGKVETLLFHRPAQFALEQRLDHQGEEVDGQQGHDAPDVLQIDRCHAEVGLELGEPLFDDRLTLVGFQHLARVPILQIGDQREDAVIPRSLFQRRR